MKEMGCNEIKLWSFVGLVGAFLDVTIVLLLLIVSTIAYLVSKFLSLFGLSLPCPCSNGLFGDPNNSGKCWQRVLVNCPSGKLSSVQFSVKSKFPFDSIWDKNINRDRVFGKLEDEVSCNSVRERKSDRVDLMSERDAMEDKFDGKGKGIWKQKVRNALRRRRKGATDIVELSSSFDTLQSDVQALPQSPASVNMIPNENNEDGRNSSSLLRRQSQGLETNESAKERKPAEKDESRAEDLKFKMPREFCDGNDDKSTIRVLELALEEEQAACSALYFELEKERSAAATAADEAMAMILRLQEDKASIEMEARQYQRMMEEKSAYDLEEMNILKEILVRREREKHFLEKEVETYRQMILGSEQFDSDAQDIRTSDEKRDSPLLYSGEDPMLMLQKISESIGETEKVETANEFGDREVKSIESCEVENPIFNQECFSSDNVELNEEAKELELLQENVPFPQEKEVKILELTNDSEKGSKDLSSEWSNMDPYIHDIHVIHDEADMCDKVGGKGSERLSEDVSIEIPRSCDSPVLSRPQPEQSISRSCSEIISGLPPRGFSQRKPLVSDLRRNSMSAVDYERFKIDNEVGWLRERLKIIQEGREKLNISMDHKENENAQLQLSENIVSQLREMRQLAEPGRAGHQVSLPPPSCKIMSKKRRWRSTSLEVRRST